MKEQKPTLIFDGDCRFCRVWIDYWASLTGDKVDYEPYQKAGRNFRGIPREEFAHSIKFVTGDHKVYSGAEAAFRVLSTVPGKRWMIWAYRKFPGYRFFSEWFYRLVAKHRGLAYGLTRLFWGIKIRRQTFVITRWIFLRFLGVIYLIAFLSIFPQIPGLMGTDGILPAGEFLQRVEAGLGPGFSKIWNVPTLAWMSASDGFLQFLSISGILLSVLLIVGVLSFPALFLLWLLYLSLLSVGQDFLSFQWDILLLEVGFLAIFLTHKKIFTKISKLQLPRMGVVFLFWLLLFRLTFSSGVVKLLSGDELWRSLTALSVHYETQPLPTVIAWFAHQLPEWFQKLSVAVTFGIEIGIPFLIFAPKRLRYISGALMLLLQFLIILSGNYTFFNLLAIALILMLYDDEFWRKVLPQRFNLNNLSTQVAKTGRVFKVVAILILFLGVTQLGSLLLGFQNMPKPLPEIYAIFAPLRIVNSYGLFAVMTNPRREIVIEGSSDKEEWKVYEFKYKPQDPSQRPRLVAPFQPRLDWQMWFAALNNYQNTPWFVNFATRLLQGEEKVIRLLENNPFPDNPPKYIRAQFYEYHFTSREERKETGDWWKREYLGLYLPESSLPENQPVK